MIASWLDERSGWRKLREKIMDDKVPGGASWSYIFGSVTAFILVMQAVTGTLLALYYSPSSTDAWASVAYLEGQVPFGWLVRGLHSHGASALIIVLGLHLLQVAVYGAYKKPRELTWIAGVMLLGLVLAFSLTGYLLPWDQKGYWATKVATGIMGSTPVIGGWLQRLVQGGNEYGNLTLTRFFTLHVLVLPWITAVLVGLHVMLSRRRGVTPRWNRSDEDIRASSESYGRRQLGMDGLAMMLVYGLVVAWTVMTGGVGLEAPADPSSNYQARPEWFFSPLFQVLKYFDGPAETIVALAAPAVIFGTLIALPFVDRGPSRSPRERKKFLAVIFTGVVGTLVLIGLARLDDARDENYQLARAEATKQAERALALSKEGVATEGGHAVWENEPYFHAKKLWDQECSSCHQGESRKGPLIEAGYNSRAWIRDFLLAPDGPRFFGPSGLGQMKPVKARGAELDALVEIVYSQTGAADVDTPLAARGRELFENGTCTDCHSLEPGAEGDIGPNLAGRGSRSWLADLIAHPGHPSFFGDANEMPAFGDELSRLEREQLADWLASLAREPAP